MKLIEYLDSLKHVTKGFNNRWQPYEIQALSLHPRLRIQPASTKTSNSETTTSENPVSSKESPEVGGEQASEKQKTQAELDDEVRQKLEAMSGDGGAAGIELEDGQPVSMKRSVKNNMFRYI